MLLNDTILNPFRQIHADDYEHSFNWSQTEILGQAGTRHVREFNEACHSMDRSTFNRHIDIATIYHASTQTTSKPSTLIIIFDDYNSHPTNIRNATTTRKLTTGTSSTTTINNAQSTNDNIPVNHQTITQSKRLESQRRVSELDIKHLKPRNPRTSDEESKHRNRKLKIITPNPENRKT